MNSSLNNEPQNKQQAYSSLLKDNIQPTDKIFSARQLLNILSSNIKYLLNHSITFEEDSPISSSQDWDYIRPETAYNYISLSGNHAPDLQYVSRSGVVFTFNQVNEGLWQFVVSSHGMAYRKVGNQYTWDYIGQGIPGNIDIHSLIDENHLNKFQNYIASVYSTKNDLKSATSEQATKDMNISASILSNSTKASSTESFLSSINASISSSTNSELNSPTGLIHTTINSNNNNVNSLSNTDQIGRNNIVSNDIPISMSSGISSLTGSYYESNGVSNYDQYNSGIYRNQQSAVQVSGSQQFTPGSVYVNASLIDKGYSKESNDISLTNKNIVSSVVPNLKSIASTEAYQDASGAVVEAQDREFEDVDSLSAIVGNTKDSMDLLSASASEDAMVTLDGQDIKGKTLLAVSSVIDLQDGAAILGNNYNNSLTSFSPSWNSTQVSELNHATSLTVENAQTYSEDISNYNSESNRIITPNSSMISSANSQVNSTCSQARSETLKDINNVRVAAGLPELKIAYQNQVISNLRIPAVKYIYNSSDHSDLTVHGEDKLHGYTILLNNLLNFSLEGEIGENCSAWKLGKEDKLAIGSTKPIQYTSDNGIQEADNTIDDMLNHDGTNAHRKNILNPKYNYIGITYLYDPIENKGIEVQEFSQYTPKSFLKAPVIHNIPEKTLIDYRDQITPQYLSYVADNSFDVSDITESKKYRIEANFPDHNGSVGISNSPYLEFYDNLARLPEKNGVLIGRYGTYYISHQDLMNEINYGFLLFNYVPSSNVDTVYLVGIPNNNADDTKVQYISVTSLDTLTSTHKVNYVASENADTINYLMSQLGKTDIQIKEFENTLGSYQDQINSNSNELDSMSNNTNLYPMPTQELASNESNNVSNTIYTYPQYTQSTGDNSITEKSIINWCNANGLNIQPSYYKQIANDGTTQYPTESDNEYHYRQKKLIDQAVGFNKDKIAAILGIIKTKTNFGKNGNNYLGYFNYNENYNNVSDYLTYILKDTIGAWSNFLGDYTISSNSFNFTGINPTQLSDSNKGNSYALAEWLDTQIDSSNTDQQKCGQNAQQLRSILY